MHANEALIHTFYQAFQDKDPETMKACYHPDAVFNDEAFRNLNAYEAGMMWEMLLAAGKDLQLEFSGIEADDKSGKAQWVATYSFSRTRRKVVNKIDASFEFRDGKIFRHTDHFDFYRWARQAFGLSGLLIGWAGFFRKKVQSTARARLMAYLSKNQQ